MFLNVKKSLTRRNYVGQIGDYIVYRLDSARGETAYRNNDYSGPVTISLGNTQSNESDVIIQPMYTTTKRPGSFR